jgi:hypothetical protein
VNNGSVVISIAFSRYISNNCVSLEDGPKEPKHVVNKEKNNINKLSVVIAGICLKDNLNGVSHKSFPSVIPILQPLNFF